MLASKTHLFDRPRDGLSFAPFEHRLSLIAEENKRVAQKRRWAPVFLTPGTPALDDAVVGAAFRLPPRARATPTAQRLFGSTEDMTKMASLDF